MVNQTENSEKILVYKCPDCGKEIKSLYPKQLEFLKGQHQLSHKLKQK